MEPHHETGFPTILSRWLREIVLSLPEAARATVAELMIGALLAGGGHVTQAFLALTPRLGWQAYHGMIERGRFRRLGLVAARCAILRREVAGRCFAILDDTLAPRSSARAPGAAVRGQDQPAGVPALPVLRHAVGGGSLPRPAACRPGRHRLVPQHRQCRQAGDR
jgi:hypothetical protein